VIDPDKVILTLLSDAIVTDPWGRFEQGFEADWLTRELGLPKGVAVETAPEDQQQRRFSVVRTVDAFNAKLGLPRSRDVALVAGSGVRLMFKGIALPALQNLLDTAEQRGIGLRRDEGFGRVAFNHPIHQQCTNWNDGALTLGDLALSSALQDHDQIRVARFEQEWREKLDDKITPKLFAYPPFETVARLEHVSGATSQQTAATALDGLGKQEQLLLHPLAGRDKKNFYETDGRPGIDKVLELLDDLGTLIAEKKVDASVEQKLWRIGLQMLADRIAEPARRKAQEGR
jgi:CRISPR-associated protein Csx10